MDKIHEIYIYENQILIDDEEKVRSKTEYTLDLKWNNMLFIIFDKIHEKYT